VICWTGGYPCLLEYLKKNNLGLPTTDWLKIYEATNGKQYAINSKGEVWTYPSMSTLICKASADPLGCLLYFLSGRVPDVVEPDYQVYDYNGVKYAVYPNGTVTLIKDGTVICKTGGYQCLLDNLLKLEPVEEKPAYTLFKNPKNNDLYRVYITGTVTFDNGTLICATGGYPCLYDWLLKQQELNAYDIVQLEDGRKFQVNKKTGEVIDLQTNKVICVSGGIPCLKLWLEENTPHYVNAGGEIFAVYKNGTVTFENGKLLCIAGSYQCIRDWLAGQKYTTYFLDGEKFKIFGDGKVTHFDNDTVICPTGGEPCLLDWWKK